MKGLEMKQSHSTSLILVRHADVQKQQEANGAVSRLVRERWRVFDFHGSGDEAGPTVWHWDCGMKRAAVGMEPVAPVLLLLEPSEAATETPREKQCRQFVTVKS